MLLFKQIVKEAILSSLSVLMLVFLISGGCSQKSEEKEIPRIGILSGLQWFDETIKGFKAGMKKLGYIEGDTILYIVQKAHIDPALQEEVLNKFIADKVDVILVYPTEASLLAKQITRESKIPVVFTNAVLEGNTLVEDVRQPGGNITGVRYPGPECLIKRLEFLRDLAPEAKNVLVFYDPDYPTNIPTLELLRPAAFSNEITLVEVRASTPGEIREELKKRSDSGNIGIDAILMMSEIVSTGPDSWKAITEFGYQHKIPILGGIMVPGEKGCLLGYSPDAYKVGEAAAPLADKILTGIPAGSIPVISPDSYLHLNYKQAVFLGIDVPDGILAQAVEIAR